MLFWVRKSMVSLAVWSRALSCWNTKKTLCGIRFHTDTQTYMCSLVSYIEGLDFEKLALNLVQQCVTFSSPKMWWMNPRVQPSKWPFAPACVQEGGWYGDGSAMVWAEISNNRRTNLVRVQGNLTGQRYKDDILQQHILLLKRWIVGWLQF
jgi:hypothetical protein